MAFAVSRFSGHKFGAMVTNLSVEDITSSAIKKELRQVWLDAGVVVFRGLPDTTEVQIALSEVFGELAIHPVAAARVPGTETLQQLKNVPDNCDIYEVNGALRAGYLPWHLDLIYVERNNRGGILRLLQRPSSGGQTGFIDRLQLYDDLPKALKETIKGLHVVYHYNPDSSAKKFGAKVKLHKLSTMMQAAYKTINTYSKVMHPVICLHPETGRKVLNISPWFALGIYEMPGPEGDALLEELVAFCENESRVYYHVWQPGDLVLWDNWRMLHGAPGFPVGESRLAQRTTIVGDYAQGQVVPGERAMTNRYVPNM